MEYKCVICGERYPKDMIRVINGKIICEMCLERKKNNIPLKVYELLPA